MVQSGGGAAAMTPLSSGIEQDVHRRTKKNSINSGSSIQLFIRRSEEMFLIPNGLADIAAFGLALLILSLVPILLQ